MKLNKSRVEVEAKLREQIDKGSKLSLSRPNAPLDYSHFNSFNSAVDKWRTFNRAMLKSLFNDDEGVVIDYANKSGGPSLPNDEFEQYRDNQTELSGEIIFLEGLIESLEHYEEPQVAGQVLAAGLPFTAFVAIILEAPVSKGSGFAG